MTLYLDSLQTTKNSGHQWWKSVNLLSQECQPPELLHQTRTRTSLTMLTWSRLKLFKCKWIWWTNKCWLWCSNSNSIRWRAMLPVCQAWPNRCKSFNRCKWIYRNRWHLLTSSNPLLRVQKAITCRCSSKNRRNTHLRCYKMITVSWMKTCLILSHR